MDSTERGPCFSCAEPASLEARICPSCRQTLLVDVLLDRAIADGRVRYRLARSLASLGSGVPTFAAQQRAFADAQPTLARGVTRALAARIAAVVERDGFKATSRPSQAGAPVGGIPPRVKTALLVTGVLVAVTGVAFVGWVGLKAVRSAGRPQPLSLDTPAAIPVSGDRERALSTRELAKRSLSSTVSLRCEHSVASGFFVTSDTILTNAHALCEGMETPQVALSDGRKLPGALVRSDRRLDLALIKVAGAGAKPLPLGDAADAVVGDRVVLIGSPVGLEFTVHEGAISSLARSLRGLAYIQIDAKVNPGNSGGPLLDGDGRVVGVVSLKHGGAEGIGLALPINYAYLGDERLVAPPADRSQSQRFEEGMMARARSAGEEARQSGDASDASASRLPMLVAASVDSYDRLVTHIVEVSDHAPAYRMITVKVWSGAETLCVLKGDVSEWTVLDEKAPPVRIDNRIVPYLLRRRIGARLYIGGGPLRWDLCPRERMRDAVVLELEGGDPEASRLQIGVYSSYR